MARILPLTQPVNKYTPLKNLQYTDKAHNCNHTSIKFKTRKLFK